MILLLKNFIRQNLQFGILFVVFLLAETVVCPLGNFPLNDDWSYAKSVLILQFDDKLTIGDWPAMTLFTHIIWGFLFTKTMGFSFLALRISTMISSLIGLLILYTLVKKITGDKITGLMASMILLLNPIYFNLSNTYMTDINFITLLILDCYLIYNFFNSGKLSLFFWIFLISALLVLLRQFGIIVPLSFTLACLMNKERRILDTSLAILVTILVFGALKYYEAYLERFLPGYATYKFSGKVDVFDNTFQELFLRNFKERYKTVLLQLVVFLSPFTLLFLPARIRGPKPWLLIVSTIAAATLTYWIFRQEPFPFKNVFANMSVGPETFYQNTQTYIQHSYSESFAGIMDWVKLLLSALFFLGLILLFHRKSGEGILILKSNSFYIFLIGIVLFYVAELFITESFFDRYVLPILPVAIILVALHNKQHQPDVKWTLLLLPFFFYVSVFGTKDYFALNTKKWEAYQFLRLEKNIPPAEINAGFEINCWDQGQISWWNDYLKLEGYNYLIQFKSEPGFSLLKSYEFQRYFPYKTDKINIFARDSIINL